MQETSNRTFDQLSSTISKLSTLDEKLTQMSKKSNTALNSLMILKFMSKYQHLDSTSYNKNTAAFFHLDKNLVLEKNFENEFKLEISNNTESEEYSEILQIITEKVDDEFQPQEFNGMEDFLKWNKKRSEMINQRFNEWKKDGQKLEEEKKLKKLEEAKKEYKSDLPDAGKRFNVITISNPKIRKVQSHFKNYLESCLEIVKELRKIKTVNKKE